MKITVTHPAATPLAYNLVAGLQARGHDVIFDTGFYYKPRLARLVERLPTRFRRKLERELGRRFQHGIDPDTVRLCDWQLELVRVISNRLGMPQNMRNAMQRLHESRLDQAAARWIPRDRPDIAIAHDDAASRTLEAARAHGIRTVLNQVVGHRSIGRRLLREECTLCPEFADSIPGNPQAADEEVDTAEIIAADSILVPSSYVSVTLQEIGVPEERIVVLPYGVDASRFRPQNTPRRPFRVLFVGQISQRKGIRYLLESFKRLKLKEAELILVGGVIGSGDCLARYRDIFTHVHNVPYAEVHRYFSTASIFVYPSLHEGSALAIFEALASGLPVITTPNSGSVVRDGTDGYIVPIRDTEALMDRMQHLYDDEDLRQSMAQNARTRAEEYSWDKYSDNLERVLKGMVTAPAISSLQTDYASSLSPMMATAPT